jgi:hypothetical protein
MSEPAPETPSAPNREGYGRGLFIGMCIATAMWSIGFMIATGNLQPRSFTGEAELRKMDHFTRATYPMTIKLVLEPAKQIQQESTPNTVAYAMPHRNPCVIVLPSDHKIEAWPAASAALFVDPQDNETFAHELLHCMVGAWHPE